MFATSDLIKYLLEGTAVALAAFYIPKGGMTVQEIAIIALTAAATFAILDFFAPTVAAGTRQGAGFGIGYNITQGLEGFESDGLRDCVSGCLKTSEAQPQETPELPPAVHTPMAEPFMGEGEETGGDHKDMPDYVLGEEPKESVPSAVEDAEPFSSGPAFL